jgi:ABC-type multidrug transport system ATPase subunit
MDPVDATSPVIVASGLTLHTRRGPVYGPIDLTVSSGDYAVVTGPAGSGKTALLLSLAGRMRPSAGSLTVAGIDALRHPAAVRQRCALAVFTGLNDLPGALTVGDAIASDLHLAGVSARSDRVAATARAFGLAGELGTKVDDLSEGQRCALGVAVALVSAPAVLLVDDIGAGLAPDEQIEFDSLLRGVAARGVAVVGSCVDRATAAGAKIVPILPLIESEVAL